MTIDPTSDRPVYKQIADQLRTAIHSGELGPGAQLPSEQELIDAHGVSRGTVRAAVKLLAGQGLIDVRHGRGSYVRARWGPSLRDVVARMHTDAACLWNAVWAAYGGTDDLPRQRAKVEQIQRLLAELAEEKPLT